MEQEKERETKLLIDQPSNFKFHAAYLAYSRAWDENPTDEVRMKLNSMITALNSDEVNYRKFYSDLSQFRNKGQEFHLRARIQGQRKRDWRRSQKKNARNSRYR